jgi:uncharacterized protein (UPF0261 family)
MDISMREKSPSDADISNAAIAEAGGSSIADVVSSNDRKLITETMVKGATLKAKERFDAQEADGIIGLGGTTGTIMSTRVMGELRFAIPKVMLSSAAPIPGLCTRFFGSSDITMMYTVADVGGLNYFLKPLLASGAAAICGMAEAEPRRIFEDSKAESKGLIAMSELGGCEKCATHIKQYLTEKGWEIVGFMANGLGDRAMEDQIGKGIMDGVIDLAPGAVAEELFGGMRAAGPNRLENAGSSGIPQVIAPFGLNMFAPKKSRYKPEYQKRKRLEIDSLRAFVKLSSEELVKTAEVVAEKLNKSKGPVKFLVPLKGWSNIEREGLPFYDSEADSIFIQHLKKNLKPEIDVEEIDANLEDETFARAAALSFEQLYEKSSKE